MKVLSCLIYTGDLTVIRANSSSIEWIVRVSLMTYVYTA